MIYRAITYLGCCGAVTALLGALLLNGQQAADSAASTTFPANRQLVRSLGLTDLSLWTEARYTRHPSQADLFTPFQENPAAIDHFPAGSILAAQSPKLATAIRVIKKVHP